MTLHSFRPIVRSAAFFALFVWASTFGSAQVENMPKKGAELPDFFVDALSFSADTLGTRLDVYVQVPYEELHFLKIGNDFDAKFEVTLGLLSPDNRLIAEKNWVEDIRVPTFEETVSKGTYSLTERSFVVGPGKYTLRVQVREGESKQLAQVDRVVQVPDFADASLRISDIMIINKLSVEDGKKNISPNVSSNIGDLPGGFHLFFEVYNRTTLDTVELTYSVVSPKQLKFFTHSQLEPVLRGRTQVFFKIDSLDLPVGNYKFVIEARKPVNAPKQTGEEIAALAVSEKAFNARWAGMPHSVTSLDVSIEEMRYVAKESELDLLRSAPTLEEKQKRFLEFWNKRDPTPGTAQNELMEEYFNRVDYANRHFSHYVVGWKTDMGMVYIVLGAPSSVDRHPFEYDSKPYEIWYYFERNRRFVFLDETGFGDYRLISPLGDLWQRY